MTGDPREQERYTTPRSIQGVPNYPTHARWGRVSAVAVALLLAGGVYAVFSTPLLAVAGAAGAAVTTFVGAIYPDIDHHSSIPRRKAVQGVRVLAGLAVVGLAVTNHEAVLAFAGTTTDALPPAVVGVALTAAGTLLVGALADPAIGLVTWKHRGWTHSALLNLVLVGTLVAGVWVLMAGRGPPQRLVAAAVVGSFFFGTLVHLGLDGEVP
jgi:hypothetical protein